MCDSESKLFSLAHHSLLAAITLSPFFAAHKQTKRIQRMRQLYSPLHACAVWLYDWRFDLGVQQRPPFQWSQITMECDHRKNRQQQNSDDKSAEKHCVLETQHTGDKRGHVSQSCDQLTAYCVLFSFILSFGIPACFIFLTGNYLRDQCFVVFWILRACLLSLTSYLWLSLT